MNQALNFWKNLETGKVKKMWQTKRQYENMSFDFLEKHKQVGGL